MSPGYQAGVASQCTPGPPGKLGGVEEPVLVVEDLAVDFPVDRGPVVHAVRGVSFSIEAGRVLGIVGESGSGKSVTALAVMGLLPPRARVSGSVRYRGRELLGLPDREMRRVRGRHLAMVFQDPVTALNPVYRVGWQLAEAVLAHQEISKKQAWTRAVELLELVGIPDAAERARAYPHQYSGGMCQRAVIAMAMANDPDVIIADEPTTALDVTVQAQILETVRRAQQRTSAAIVLITHDLGVVAGMADDVLVMYAGRAVETGPVDEVYERPRMPYTRGLLASLPRVDVDGGALTPIPGAPPSPDALPPGCPFSPRCAMAEARCAEAEPSLDPVDETAVHRAACHRAGELAVPAGPVDGR
jgi:peptide/nickel transport system ATP-binding protein